MKVRPIQFVPDVAEAVRFYEALGLTAEATARSGHWVERQRAFILALLAQPTRSPSGPAPRRLGAGPVGRAGLEPASNGL